MSADAEAVSKVIWGWRDSFGRHKRDGKTGAVHVPAGPLRLLVGITTLAGRKSSNVLRAMFVLVVGMR